MTTSPADARHLFFFGGAQFGKVNSSVFRLDLSREDVPWERVATVTGARFPQAAVLGGLIYVAGRNLEAFNPLDNTVKDLGPFPVEAADSLALLPVGRRLAAISSNGPVAAFDLDTRAWSHVLPALPKIAVEYSRARF